MHRSLRASFVVAPLSLSFLAPAASTAGAQTFRTADTVIRKMWTSGVEHSQTEKLAQALFDSIGPRLNGSPGYQSAVDWLTKRYELLGIPVKREQYGTWRGWKQGTVNMQLTAPRVQNLDVHLLAWSPGTNGKPVEGDAVILPDLADDGAAKAWLATVKGKFVLASAPEMMCRAPQELEKNARPATVQRINARRRELQQQGFTRLKALAGSNAQNFNVQRLAHLRLDSAGVAGIVTSLWSNGWGVDKIFNANATRVPTVDLMCEDYGLAYRLAQNNQGPKLRLYAETQASPQEVPMHNVIARIEGTELPNEYVVLSAHLDSWHGATGATDNGTGTLTMLEAMRILKENYPRPRRTIIAGHWGGEEGGGNGSRSFVEDHPEVMTGLQTLFNQDNGTWKFEILEGQGFLKAGGNLARWVAQLPAELGDNLRLQVPGNQANTGSDHTSFICYPAPAFRLQSPYDEYRQYTWHTNRDTYDKIVFDDLKENATTAAMLAYAASEDPEKVSREQALLPPLQPGGQARSWPTCSKASRRYQ